MFAKPNILLIGGGHMGRALLAAWRKAKCVADVTVVDPHPSAELQKIATKTVTDLALLDAKTDTFDAIILATKPQITDQVMPLIASFVSAENFFLSIAAGRDTAYYQKFLPPSSAIIRAMPNTPCQIGQGVTALYATPHVSQAAMQVARSLFIPTGMVFECDDEEKMHAITAVMASGPGFIFYLMECLPSKEEAVETVMHCTETGNKVHGFYTAYCNAAAQLNMTDKVEQIITQLFHGTAQLAAQSSETLADLRAAVTSPNGTTAAGLKILMQSKQIDQLAAALPATFQAAITRSQELLAG